MAWHADDPKAAPESPPERSAYFDLTSDAERLLGIRAPFHQVLGHPRPVQNEMQLECQLVTNGLNCGASGYEDPRRGELEKGAMDWRLLLQIDSDDAASMMWGDLGMIYFWIRADDLRRREFDKTWSILQCG